MFKRDDANPARLLILEMDNVEQGLTEILWRQNDFQSGMRNMVRNQGENT